MYIMIKTKINWFGSRPKNKNILVYTYPELLYLLELLTIILIKKRNVMSI